MIIKNVKVYTEEKTFKKGGVLIRDGVFASVEDENAGDSLPMRKSAGESAREDIIPGEFSVSNGMPDEDIIDGQGCFLIPGLVDIHFHGCVGYDFSDGTEKAIENIARHEASCGVTTIVPATMTLPEDELFSIMKAAGDYARRKSRRGCEAGGIYDRDKAGDDAHAVLAGINMEGPFISKEKKGAQSADAIRTPDTGLFRKLQKASGGMIRLACIAPETDGAMEFIKALKDEVRISFAHTMADYETAKKGYDLGACHVTHLYNAMPPFLHREPGVIGAALDSPHVMAELICDGIHVHPSAVRGTFRMFGDDRIVLISDSMRACGLTDGIYTLGGQEVKVRGKLATLTADGAIAGSVTNLMDCLRVAVLQMGIPLESAVACATMNPAKSVGIYDTYGSITPGKAGNAVLLDEDLKLHAVVMNGKLVRSFSPKRA